MKKTYLCIVIIFILICSCRRNSNEMSWFFDQPEDVRKSSFKNMSFEQQYNIYIFAMIDRSQHPPDLYYADAIAIKGKSIVPELLTKLENTNNDHEKEVIYYLFGRMSTYCCYNITTDKKLLNYLINYTSTIKDQYYKQLANETMKDILTKSVDR